MSERATCTTSKMDYLMQQLTFIAVAYWAVFSSSLLQAQVETFDLPRLDDVRIDGDFRDWDGEQGFGVEGLLQTLNAANLLDKTLIKSQFTTRFADIM